MTKTVILTLTTEEQNLLCECLHTARDEHLTLSTAERDLEFRQYHVSKAEEVLQLIEKVSA